MAPPVQKGAAFFDDLLKDKDAEFAKRVKEVVGEEDPTPGSLFVKANNGTLVFQTDVVVGTGNCDKKGAGNFSGNALQSHVQGGTFKLWLTPTTAKLELYDNSGSLLDTYNGGGSQVGLTTTATTPWEGDWN
ncbi:hypothetical protein EWM64_g9790 [Hericium alpestre]|uniref:Uncharacterized protein n=1 Tax=Hericium alpestre TaxID=135208 RepID=A0A4Y9ZHV9_9AGAM|nr:hypothetical protein EWM64_g9790 [Hericium alpestre]